MKQKVFVATDDEIKQLKKNIKAATTGQALVLRSKIILMSLDGANCKKISDEVGASVKTVGKWQENFKGKGIKGLNDAPRSGRPQAYGAVQRCEIIAIACDSPKNYGHDTYDVWTIDLLTETIRKAIPGLENVSRSAVVRTLGNYDLKPHKTEQWLHSKDVKFNEKVQDIVTTYQNDLDTEAVVCVDEKPMVANEQKYEMKMPTPGKAGKEEYEYIRHGTQTLIAGFDVKKGEVYAHCQDTRKGEDLTRFMEGIAVKYKGFDKIHIVWDNLNTHHEGKEDKWSKFNERHGNKFVFHYTPLHASWVNQVEIFFSILHRRILKHGSYKSKEDLRNRVLAFIAKWNKDEKHPFKWMFKGFSDKSKEGK